MAAQMLLLNETIPVEALRLGSLVDSLKSPAMDAFTLHDELPADAVISTQARSFGALFSSAKSPSFKLHLSQMLNIDHVDTKQDSADLNSTSVRHYQLKQPRQVFKQLCQNSAAREWLNDGIQSGRKSYMVVDLQTAEDPSLTQRQEKKHETSLDANVPVSLIATGGMDVLGLGSVLDSGAGGGYSNSTTAQKQAKVEGEAIFAIGFKKIVWKSWGLRRKEVDEASLDADIKWTILGARRSRSDENEDELVSVDLSDDLQAADESGSTENKDADLGGDDLEEEDDEDEFASLSKQQVQVGDQTYLMFEENDAT